MSFKVNQSSNSFSERSSAKTERFSKSINVRTDLFDFATDDQELRRSTFIDVHEKAGDNDEVLERQNSDDSALLFALEGTLISRQWYYVMPSAVIAYVCIQLFISRKGRNFCNIDEPFADWTQKIAIAVLACFSLSMIYHITNGISVECWAQKELSHLRGVYASAATMSFIGGASTGLYTFNLGGRIIHFVLSLIIIFSYKKLSVDILVQVILFKFHMLVF